MRYISGNAYSGRGAIRCKARVRVSVSVRVRVRVRVRVSCLVCSGQRQRRGKGDVQPYLERVHDLSVDAEARGGVRRLAQEARGEALRDGEGNDAGQARGVSVKEEYYVKEKCFALWRAILEALDTRAAPGGSARSGPSPGGGARSEGEAPVEANAHGHNRHSTPSFALGGCDRDKSNCNWLIPRIGMRKDAGGDCDQGYNKSMSTHGVERAEALVLDDARGDAEGPAGGAQLQAHLQDRGGSQNTKS